MTFETEFLEPMQMEIENKVKKPAVEAVQIAAKAVYDSIFEKWPAFTYWSMNNHRISVGGSLEFDLVPSQRPMQANELADQIETTRSHEVAKLKDLSFDSLHVVIGNAVPYAEDININPITGKQVRASGSGAMIYIEAAAEGTVEAEAAIQRGSKT